MQRIRLNDLRQRLNQNDIALFDVRGDDKYEAEHIPGAKTAPLTALRERVDGIVERDTDLAVYCGSTDCDLSEKAARNLDEMGFEHVYEFEEGLKGWKDAGLDTVERRETRA
jgi:rhodanese-related sulfurtransferase